MKRITALLLTVIIMLSGAGVINAFAADKGDVIIIDNSDYGDFVAPVFDADGIIAGTEQDEFDGCLFFMKGVMANPLPSSYDSRNRDGVNVVTPVKSQSPYGNLLGSCRNEQS